MSRSRSSVLQNFDRKKGVSDVDAWKGRRASRMRPLENSQP